MVGALDVIGRTRPTDEGGTKGLRDACGGLILTTVRILKLQAQARSQKGQCSLHGGAIV